jgi:hypothetical protein
VGFREGHQPLPVELGQDASWFVVGDEMASIGADAVAVGQGVICWGMKQNCSRSRVYDTARTRMMDAMQSLELVKLEESNRERFVAHEQSSFEQLSQLSGAYPIPLATKVTAASMQVNVDYRVHELTRLRV